MLHGETIKYIHVHSIVAMLSNSSAHSSMPDSFHSHHKEQSNLDNNHRPKKLLHKSILYNHTVCNLPSVKKQVLSGQMNLLDVLQQSPAFDNNLLYLFKNKKQTN